MSLRVALQMDPPGSINPVTDTSMLLGLEALRRGCALYYYSPEALSLRDNALTASGHSLTFYDRTENFYTLGERETLNLADMDVILLRQDPPFDMAYITTTFLLESLPKRTKVFNNPFWVRNMSEKLSVNQFPEFAAPTLVSRDKKTIADFHREHGDIVVKPLYSFGGKSVFHLRKDDDNLSALLEHMFALSREPLMVQRFIPQVSEQERRIILIDGEIGGIMGRIPATGEIRANMRVGGKAVKAELTPRQREMCDALKPVLKERGLLLAGIDVIGDYLTEINVTSPTGLRAMNGLYNTRLEQNMWDAIESYLP